MTLSMPRQETGESTLTEFDVTEHPPETVTDRWVMCTFQRGCWDGMEEPQPFETKEEAVAAAREWAEDIGSCERYQHEAVVLQVVSVFRGPRTFADL
jgi:hypothetical protein